MKIFCNAGHFQKDSGATINNLRENELAMEVRDNLRVLLQGKRDVFYVPDELTLKESIDWVNERAQPEDFALDIHFNSSSNPKKRGTEVYYAIQNQYHAAEVLSMAVSERLMIPNFGATNLEEMLGDAKHDSTSYVGSLGWVRQLKCLSVLIEVCYLTNPEDRKMLMTPQGRKLAAGGIKEGIDELFPIKLTLAQKRGLFDVIRAFVSDLDILEHVKRALGIEDRLFGAQRNPKWRELRNAYFAANPKCELCGRKGKEIHHIVPVWQDKSKELLWENLICVCKKCHLDFAHLGDYHSWEKDIKDESSRWQAKRKNRP